MADILEAILIFILALLPIIILAYYIYYQDNEKESKVLLLKLFFGGFISAIMTVCFSFIIRSIFPSFFDDVSNFSVSKLLVYTFIIVSLIEEVSKFIIVYLFSYNNKEYDQLYDMIVYSAFVSLGFAWIENLIYTYDGGISIAISRSLSAVPIHASVAIFMGYYLSFSKYYDINKKKKLRRKNLIYSIIVPILLHGTYDFLAFSSNRILVFVFYLFLSLLIINANRRLQRISKSNNYIFSNNDDLEVI